ncbi:MAG TPA: hypothetical protein VGU64_00130 [Terriglobales bacterium]|nr:hypothetical protein [Terriglobales bacterium]
MGSSVQARLDAECQRIMRQLVKKTGWTPSQVLREGLRLLASCHVTGGRRTIIAQGKFPSGVGDLASNKRHLQGFGR